MNLLKKLALLGLAAVTSLSLGIISACDDDTSSSSSPESSSSSSSSVEDAEPATFVYRVKVQNATGYGLRGARVALYDGETEIAKKTTNANGYATFGESDIDSVGEYEVRISDLPRGYVMAEPDRTYSTGAWEGFELSVQLDPTGVIKEDAPLGTTYALGEVMYDFTVATSEGKTFTLSEVLEEKDMVLINFWATWCGPCRQEFPAMNNAYVSYEDQVAVLAVSTTDAMRAVTEFKSSNGLAFDMTSNSESGYNLAGMFNTAAIPLSVMVDRYGVITYYHAGSMELATDFTTRFDRFLGENYQPTVIIGAGEENEGGSGGDGTNLVKPNVSAPALSDIKTTLGGGDFEFSWNEEDEYSWPWLISEDKDYIYSPITTIHGGYSTLTATFEAAPGDAIFFDYMVNTETSDILYVLVDGVPVQQISGGGGRQNWTNDFGGYVFREFDTEGTHELTFLYMKDSAGSIDAEGVWLKNLRLEHSADGVNANIFRHAANKRNEAENATALYEHYATVVLNDEDGYYHVGTEDGPLLFANLMLSSRWSEQSLWNLAYSGYIVVDGYNFSGDIEEHAWAANQPVPGKELTYGYAPVTEDLKELLVYATKSKAVGEDGYKIWTGEWHDKEWLELCVYFENYGDAEPIEDPMKTITFHAAEKVETGTVTAPVANTANVPFAMTPRGFKYKIVPETSGVYNIYSVGNTDTVCFFFGESTTNYGYYDNVLNAEEDDGNFNFHVYLEAGRTYYLALTTFLDQAAEYDFYVTYIGTEYRYMEACATSYSFNEISGELFLLDAVEYAYNEETDTYHVRNADGSLGDTIYVDMTRPTHFSDVSLFATARDALRTDENDEPVYELEERAFYVNGVDYSQVIYDYARNSQLNDGDLEGYVALNKELYDIFVALMTSERYDGIEESWQLLCYYYTTLGA